jgi:hypothetical protein
MRIDENVCIDKIHGCSALVHFIPGQLLTNAQVACTLPKTIQPLSDVLVRGLAANVIQPVAEQVIKRLVPLRSHFASFIDCIFLSRERNILHELSVHGTVCTSQ